MQWTAIIMSVQKKENTMKNLTTYWNKEQSVKELV